LALSFGAPPLPIGLDIGTDHIRAAQIKPSGAGFALSNYGIVSMPLGAVVEGEIVDPAAVSGAIKELWRRHGFRSKDVAIGVSNQKVVVRLIDLPFMERAELEGAIQYQAQDYIPIPVEDAILDFQIIGDYMTPADEHMMEVLLVAAQRDMVDNAVQAVEGAGLKLAAIDVTAFALVRSLLGPSTGLFSDEEEAPGEASGIIQMSSGLTTIAVVERGVTRFTRVSALAGSTFTQAIANVLNMTFDEAEELKLRAGLPDIEAPAPIDASTPDGQMVQVAQEALEREANKFIAEVRRSLDYYLTQTTQVRTIRRIYLTGAASQLRNLAQYLEKGLQTQVVMGDPLTQVDVSGASGELVTQDRLGCAAAIGLGMGGAA